MDKEFFSKGSIIKSPPRVVVLEITALTASGLVSQSQATEEQSATRPTAMQAKAVSGLHL